MPNTNLHYFDINVNNRLDFCASNTMVDLMNTMSDPRIGIYFDKAVTSNTYVGEVYGLSEANGAATANDDVSQRGEAVVGATAPAVFMSYAEVQFILAEAVERGFITGTAANYYNDGVIASMDSWGVSGGDVTTYLAQPSVDYATLITGGSSWKQIIGKQKWLALYNQGLEAWAEWRRLDFGILQLPADGVMDGTGIPLRLKYPNDEQTLNGAHYTEAVGLQGADEQDTRLWWDMNSAVKIFTKKPLCLGGAFLFLLS